MIPRDAADSKRRRDDVLPLRTDLVQELRRHLGDRPTDAPAFHVPPRQHVAEVFRADVEAAGLPYKDASGKVGDFHSLRHTFITNLASGGVHPSIAQALARHSTITLTMDRYTHRHAGDETAALEVLPDLKAEPAAPPLAATGTTDRRGSEARSSEGLPPTCPPTGA
jgi:integrase